MVSSLYIISNKLYKWEPCNNNTIIYKLNIKNTLWIESITCEVEQQLKPSLQDRGNYKSKNINIDLYSKRNKAISFFPSYLLKPNRLSQDLTSVAHFILPISLYFLPMWHLHLSDIRHLVGSFQSGCHYLSG